MTSTPSDHRPPASGTHLSQWTEPIWLHARSPKDGSAGPDVLRDFARLAAPIALAAWMFGTALTSACAPADLAGRAPNAAQLGVLRGAARVEAAAAVPLCAAAIQAVAVSANVAR